MAKGKLIVIDGLDGSGKTTQTKLLVENLKKMGHNIRGIEFPDYEKPASTLIKMYLQGEFGKTADSVNPYAASCLYAMERFASFKSSWEKDYLDGKIIISARYTSSNMFHQMCKVEKEKWDDFLDWLIDFEYEKIGIPKPDMTIFLDMEPSISKTLISKRYNEDEKKRDIHESDFNYLLRCRESAFYAIDRFGFEKIQCFYDNQPLELKKIQETILKSIGKVIG